MVEKTIEIPQLQYIDKVVDVCCAGPASASAICEETVEITQLQLIEFWTGCCVPVVCNDRCRMVDDMAQFIDSYVRPCDHAATFGCDS